MTSNPLTTLTLADLQNALTLRQRIEALRAELDRLASVGPLSRRGRKRIRRKRLAAAMTAGKQDQAGRQRGPKRRKLSQAARARLSAMAKARWAKIKASGKNRL
jgi:hypothetical protein